MVIFLAGLQAIPASLYEEARVDGANAWQQIRHVTLPGLGNTRVLVINVTAIFAFRLFDQVYMMPQFPGGAHGLHPHDDGADRLPPAHDRPGVRHRRRLLPVRSRRHAHPAPARP